MGYGYVGANIVGPQSQVISGWWHQRITFASFTDADTSQVLDINALFTSNPFPSGVWFLNAWYFDLIEVFAAPSLVTATLILGIAADSNGLIEATQVQTGQTLGVKSPGGTLDEATNTYSNPLSLLLQMDTVGANLNTFTTGVVDIYGPYIRRYAG